MSGTGSVPVERQRDPKLKKLENDVFSKMNQVIQNNLPKTEMQKTTNNLEVKHVSFEDALKELRDCGKS